MEGDGLSSAYHCVGVCEMMGSFTHAKGLPFNHYPTPTVGILTPTHVSCGAVDVGMKGVGATMHPETQQLTPNTFLFGV
jgi:hypothetical protein